MSTLKNRYRPAIRRRLLAPILPDVARLVRKLDRAKELEIRLDLTEALYRFLAKHDLYFCPEVFNAADRYNRDRAAGKRRVSDRERCAHAV